MLDLPDAIRFIGAVGFCFFFVWLLLSMPHVIYMFRRGVPEHAWSRLAFRVGLCAVFFVTLTVLSIVLQV